MPYYGTSCIYSTRQAPRRGSICSCIHPDECPTTEPFACIQLDRCLTKDSIVAVFPRTDAPLRNHFQLPPPPTPINTDDTISARLIQCLSDVSDDTEYIKCTRCGSNRGIMEKFRLYCPAFRMVQILQSTLNTLLTTALLLLFTRVLHSHLSGG